MKTLVALWLLLLLILFAPLAWASCRTTTITLPDGRFMICQTCCYNGQCNTTCF